MIVKTTLELAGAVPLQPSMLLFEHTVDDAKRQAHSLTKLAERSAKAGQATKYAGLFDTELKALQQSLLVSLFHWRCLPLPTSASC